MSRRKLNVNLHPTECNICGGPVIYTSNSRIYGREYGSGKCYLCRECGAYVGTHIPRPEEAFGILSDARMRSLKKQCHELFDKSWLNEEPGEKRKLARANAYEALSVKLDIEPDCCHFGFFDTELLLLARHILLYEGL